MAGTATTAGTHPAASDSRERQRDHGRGGDREPQRPRDEAFLPPLCRQPVLVTAAAGLAAPAGAAAAPGPSAGVAYCQPRYSGVIAAASRGPLDGQPGPWRACRAAAGPAPSGQAAMSRRRGGTLTARTNSAWPSVSKSRAGITGLGARSGRRLRTAAPG